MKVIKSNGEIRGFDIKAIRKALMKAMEIMEQEIETIIEDKSISFREKNVRINLTIKIYEKFSNILKAILKSFIKSVKKNSITGLFLSSQIREKFKIYNLN